MKAWNFTFLGSPEGALWSTVFLIVWRYAGFYMLLMLVGLQGIPDEVYEAARIDGASRWQTFRGVTLPLLRPTLALTTVLCVTGSLLAFEQFYILTNGGPDNSTITVVQLIYSVAFQGPNNLGVAGALSVIVLIALIIVNVFQIRAFGQKEDAL
jgi:multiple sugar transport system permease protein